MITDTPYTSIVLASSSAYRRMQLETIVTVDDCIHPAIDERTLSGESQHDRAKRLSEAKALKVMSDVSSRYDGPLIVLAGDQTAACKGRSLEKPNDPTRAAQQLAWASGAEAEFFSGVACLFRAKPDDNIEAASRVVTSTVCFRDLSSDLIAAYLKREDVLDCAGSFKCEGLGISLFDCIESDDPSALVGMPLIATRQLLGLAGVEVLHRR